MRITRYGNPNAEHGLVLIIGTKFNNVVETSGFAAIEAALKKNNALNIAMIDFDDAPFDQAMFTNSLADFMSENAQNTVINGVHGAQVAYGTDHYSLVGKSVEDSSYFSFLGSSIINFLHGNFIWSPHLLQAIGTAANGQPLNVWQFSCQGAKLLDYAQSYLPQGTPYVAESEGYIHPEIFLNSFVQSLNSNKDFVFDDLYKDYLAMTAKVGNKLPLGWMNPVKVTIGETTVRAIDQGDQLIADIQTKTVDTVALEKAITKHCDRVVAAEINIQGDYSWGLDDFRLYGWSIYSENFDIIKHKACMDQAHTAVANAQHIQDKTYSACINEHNQRDFITATVIDWISDWLPGNDPFSLYNSHPDSCMATYMDQTTGVKMTGIFESIAEHYY